MSNADRLIINSINDELYDNTLSNEAKSNLCGFIELLNEIAQDNPQLINESKCNNVIFDLYEDN